MMNSLQVLLTEKQSADYYSSAKSSGRTRVTTFKLAVEKSKLFTNAIFSMVRVIFSTILVIPTYILPHLVPSHIANLMSIAEATITNQGKQSFLHDFNHGLQTPNEGINQRHLKIWADVADKICFGRN